MYISYPSSIKKISAWVLTGSLALSVLTAAVPGSAAAVSAQAGASQDSTKDAGEAFDVIRRVDSVTGTGLIRSHFEDEEGRLYTDTAAAPGTSGSALSAADGSGTASGSEGVSSAASGKESAESQNTGAVSQSNSKQNGDLPVSYDLRSENLTTPIKDQGITGCCWAFSAIKAIESNCIKNGLFPAEAIDFSENHLAWFSYHPATDSSDTTSHDGIISGNGSSSGSLLTGSSQLTPYETGGSAILANFTLAKWCGAELEANAPFTADTTSQERSMAARMAASSALRYDSYVHLQNVYNFDEYSVGKNYYYSDTSIISRIKQAILDYGAMSASLFYDKSFAHTTANGTAYYQTYFRGSAAVKNANHAVTIVGWDDSYSHTNFRTSPPGDGAWLIANSYGTEEGDAGYFWLSYYDPSICDCSSFLTEPVNNYQHIYQYDGFGWGTATYSGSHNLKAANIFSAEGTSAQQICAVSFYTLTDRQPYQIQIYRNVGNAPTDGTLVTESVTAGTAEHNGYHTVSLSSPVIIAPGERFSVVVTYLQEGFRRAYVPMEGRDTTDSVLNIGYGSKKGQSFLYTALAGSSELKWFDTAAKGYNNVCVKAFTNEAAAADTIPRRIRTVKLGKGEKYQIPGDYLTYVSNDPALVTVTESGRVTAKRRGTTTVTVSDETESYLIRFKVMKAPSKIRLKPSKKKQIKKGKHFRIKVKLPSGSYSRKITFRSGRPRIVSVSSSGRVTARRKGTATVTVRTFNGKKAKLRITVR